MPILGPHCQCAVLIAAITLEAMANEARVYVAVAFVYIADVVESLACSAHCYYMGRGNDKKKMKTRRVFIFFWALPRPSVVEIIATRTSCCSKGPMPANLF